MLYRCEICDTGLDEHGPLFSAFRVCLDCAQVLPDKCPECGAYADDDVCGICMTSDAEE